ncbi:acetate--CoA ligase [Halomarina ordinaria]|uniref:Acetate--CoA ligase n=1 Tax=Halomarina ordinaria TaxID=3033939 RepID=A0ABD5U833_9EURY|nr:acetate--CoA ligase [Halomarina sp. PSRA2]
MHDDPARRPLDRGAHDPPEPFVAQANVTDPDLRSAFEREWPDCWARAGDLLEWERPYESVLAGDGETPPFRWFDGGRLNASVNCVDRHLEDRKSQVAIRWEGRLGETRSYTYLDLHREVNEFAAGLRSLGVGPDDVVTLYMPMIPELPVAMLACARLGAVHNVVFAGFSAEALAARMARADSRFLVTCDGYYRRGAATNQKNKADNARISLDHEVEATVVVSRLGEETHLGKDQYSYVDLLAAHEGARVAPVARDAGDPLFLIYTSGTTGAPTAVTHTTGGYLAHVAWTARAVLDLEPEDTYWCSADIGWITGHSYIVYGPLALGATTMLYEGAPDHPERDRLWRIIERNAIDVFYTAPTAIRSFMKWGSDHPERHDLSSLRLLGTVGEPINPRAWEWYRAHIGGGSCPVVDTWWQTETGAILASTLPGTDAMKPGSVGPPLPGIEARVVDEAGEPTPPGEPGHLVVDRPWPGMPTTLAEGGTLGSTHPARDDGGFRYVAGDEATVDEDGYLTVLGRVDDVINVAGRRFSSMELESSIVEVNGVAEAAVIGSADDRTGKAVCAYVSPERDRPADDDLRARIERRVREAIGPIATPDAVVFTPELPKTRSGKIMRRLLEDIANDEPLGDTSALRNPEILGEIESTIREDAPDDE